MEVAQRALHHDQVSALVPLVQVRVDVLELIIHIEGLEILKLGLHDLFDLAAFVPVLQAIDPVLGSIQQIRLD